MRGEITYKFVIFGCVVILLLIAGCTTISSDTGTPQPMSPVPKLSVPTPSVTVVPNPVLPMNAQVVLGIPENPFTASIDSFEIDPPSEPGKQTITIYVAVKNTGTEPIQLVWFSRLTDISGKIYGGIGISHGGTGARSGLIYPNMTEAARDYVVVPEADFAQLSKGAILDVYFMEKKSDTPSLVPDYHVQWAIDPAVIA
jgi:hypothetical protein